MKRKIFFLISIILLLTLLSCSNTEKDPFIVDADEIPQSGVILRNWYVLGPFSSDGESNFLNKDNMAYFGLSESTIEYDDFIKLSSKDIKTDIILNDRFDNRKIESENFLIDFGELFGYYKMEDNISGNAYAACIIESGDDKTVYLDFSSDDGAQVWLNHERVLHIEKAESVIDYENFIPLNLKKGKNFLLIKVYNGMYYWQMYAKLENNADEGFKRHQNLLKQLNNHSFFSSSIIDTSNTVLFSKQLPKGKYALTIADENNYTVFNSTVDVGDKPYFDLSSFNEGIYYAKLVLNKDTLEQVIYKGDIIKTTENIIKELSRLPAPDKIKRFINVNTIRFKHLLLPGNRGSSASDKHFWQKKIISLYQDLNSVINRTKSGINNLKGIPGTHIKSFISEIDNNEQYYLMHVPKTYKNTDTLPLVIYMPAKLANHQEYLKSMRVADFKLIENLQEMSDKFNVIVLEPFCREVAKPNFNSIEEIDFFEVLNSVREDYNFDQMRIFLTGSCAGASKALKFAVRYPDLFSGIGVISPTFGDYNISGKEWISQNDPFNFINNIKNIPVMIIHSALDKHTSVQNSDNFILKAKEENINNVKYKRLPDVIDLFYWYEFSDSIFNFFTKIKPDKLPGSVSFSTNQLKYNKAYWVNDLKFNPMNISRIDAAVDQSNNSYTITTSGLCSYNLYLDGLQLNLKKPVKVTENGKVVFNEIPENKNIIINHNIASNKSTINKNSNIEGPFTHLFNHNFIVVLGTSGTTGENTMIRQIADSLKSAWQFKYWNGCKSKFDYEITQDDISNSNLLLIGNYNSNKILNRLKDKLPLKISNSSISIYDKTINGNKLGCYMIFPNPLNTGKYIGVIGYNNKASIALGKVDMEEEGYNSLMRFLENKFYFEITCYGWYDYKIWDNSNNYEELLSGYFDYNWN